MTRTTIAITVISLFTALTACTTTQPAPTAISPSRDRGYQRPANVQWTDHWNPTPAVDLMSAHGTFIRAFIEAEVIAVLSGSTATGSYPGFATADHTGQNPKYYSHGMPMWNYTGFSSHSIIRLDNTGPDTYIATLCRRESVNPLNEESLNVDIEWLTYHHHGTPPPANQRGPQNAPPGNVFGGWYATQYDVDFTTPKHDICTDTPIDRSHTPTPGWPTTTPGEL